MALTKLSADVNNIQNLADRPTETPAQIKAAFDKAGADIKEYINNTLTEEADSTFATKQEVADIYAGGVADNSISNAKLATDVKVGSLATLNTTDKTSVVAAVNSHLADDATTAQKGHVQLSTSTTSASTVTAATSSAVKTVMDAVKAIGGYVVGEYTGDGQTSRSIALGFKPKAVLVMSRDGKAYLRAMSSTYLSGGLATGNSSVYSEAINVGDVVKVTASGFSVYAVHQTNGSSDYDISTNWDGTIYHYIAFK